jgi:hypothetical protein
MLEALSSIPTTAVIKIIIIILVIATLGNNYPCPLPPTHEGSDPGW